MENSRARQNRESDHGNVARVYVPSMATYCCSSKAMKPPSSHGGLSNVASGVSQPQDIQSARTVVRLSLKMAQEELGGLWVGSGCFLGAVNKWKVVLEA